MSLGMWNMVEVIRMDGNSLSMHTTFLMVLSPPVNHCNVAWWQHFISVYHVKQKVVVHLLWGGGGQLILPFIRLVIISCKFFFLFHKGKQGNLRGESIGLTEVTKVIWIWIFCRVYFGEVRFQDLGEGVFSLKKNFMSRMKTDYQQF